MRCFTKMCLRIVSHFVCFSIKNAFKKTDKLSVLLIYTYANKITKKGKSKGKFIST